MLLKTAREPSDRATGAKAIQGGSGNCAKLNGGMWQRAEVSFRHAPQPEDMSTSARSIIQNKLLPLWAPLCSATWYTSRVLWAGHNLTNQLSPEAKKPCFQISSKNKFLGPVGKR